MGDFLFYCWIDFVVEVVEFEDLFGVEFVFNLCFIGIWFDEELDIDSVLCILIG